MTAATDRRIRVDGLWKKYRRGERADSLRDLLAGLGRAALRRTPSDQLANEEFWALKDVSFTVAPGEVMGVIGPNGSGKSTLLKLLTGILEPDRGEIAIRGRIGALIELAAGFHPDLTGRENVFLQGAVMGMTRAEIELRYEEIVEFAGIEDFVDTPIKRYSSGMNARLGFAIAAQMDPDVLLVDEVLSVGDYEFQRKAEERLREVVAREIPVVIVSHRMDSIAKLCDHAILLSEGGVAFAGSAAECVAAYVDGRHLSQEREEASPVSLTSIRSSEAGPFASGDRLELVVEGVVRRPADSVVVALRLWGVPGEELLFVTHNEACEIALPDQGPFAVEIDVQLNIGRGVYRLQPCVLGLRPYHEWIRGESIVVEVHDSRTAFGTVSLDPRMRLRSDG